MSRTNTDEIIDVAERIAKMDTRAKLIIMKRLTAALAETLKSKTPDVTEEKSGGTV